jgi:hypothetical protein
MLCHAQRRGGGDIPGNAEALVAAVGEKDSRAKAAKLLKGVEDVKGRWRGGRIFGTSEIRYENWPTTEEVLERGTDISDKVVRYLVAISHYKPLSPHWKYLVGAEAPILPTFSLFRRPLYTAV